MSEEKGKMCEHRIKGKHTDFPCEYRARWVKLGFPVKYLCGVHANCAEYRREVVVAIDIV